LKKGFLALDPTNTGLCDRDEFICVLDSIVKLLPKKQLTLGQIEQLAEIVDKTDEGFINWHAFLESFVLTGVQ
jgi:Ca2+-binding EF-hand superfamily protein